jgi:uncharacterized protein (DUF885 family)
MTFGEYRRPSVTNPKGTYFYNGSNLKERSLLIAEALIYHELIPGHHFQIGLQSENEALPKFRQEILHTAFAEGWANYASSLGLEMGLYQDPYSRCGKFLRDMRQASRLVVDTGMNYLEWPRTKAMQFLKENSNLSDTQIHSETLRYATDMPGQALAYHMGEIKFFEIRKRAEEVLKEKFDIRKFNQALVGSGSMPLTVLEKHIDWFIEKETAH